MLKGIGSFVGMSLLMLAVGCMAGYIYGWTTWSTYHAVGRAVKAFWLASGVLFISGIAYRAFLISYPLYAVYFSRCLYVSH